MDNLTPNDTFTNLCTPGVVMKSALYPGKLSICSLNSQSICARRLSKLDELRRIAAISNVDVICVCESWLNERIDDKVIMLDGYQVIRCDRIGRLGGGVMMYVKNGLRYNVIEKTNCDNIANTEFILVELILVNFKLLLGSFYNPPNVDCSLVLDNLLSKYGTFYNQIHFLGDFNTNMLQNSPKAMNLREVLVAHQLHIVGSEPTFSMVEVHRN